MLAGSSPNAGLTSAAIHALPAKWQRDAAAFREMHGRRQRVFVNSLADWADNQVPDQWRTSLFHTMRYAPDVDFLLLTKRVGNAHRMIERALEGMPVGASREPPWPWPNVWLGISVVNQEEAERDIPKLLAVPAAVRFLSVEPMLGLINLDHEAFVREYFTHSADCDDDDCALNGDEHSCAGQVAQSPSIDWVIVGGESGASARPFNLEWARWIAEQCKSTGTACFIKQLGANPIYAAGGSIESEGPGFRLSVTEISVDTSIELTDRKGGDWSEWPPELRIREFPRGTA